MPPASRPIFSFRVLLWFILSLALSLQFIFWAHQDIQAQLRILKMPNASDNLHAHLMFICAFLIIPILVTYGLASIIGVWGKQRTPPKFVFFAVIGLPILISAVGDLSCEFIPSLGCAAF